MRAERGSLTVEAVLLAPVLLLFVTFVVAAGRYTQAATTVRSAVDSAAREASLVSADRMRAVAAGRVAEEFALGRSWCTSAGLEVQVKTGGSGARVTVRASCAVRRQGILAVLPLPAVLSAESTEVIDAYTFR